LWRGVEGRLLSLPLACRTIVLRPRRVDKGSHIPFRTGWQAMSARKHKTILFLCTGNYYRSRYAEIFFNSVAGKMGLPWQATSRALALERGGGNVGPMAVSALAALEQHGIRAGEHGARFPMQATPADFEAADRVIALKLDEHQPLLLERFPTWADRVEHWYVDDAPHVLRLIEREVSGLVARLLTGGERPPGPLSEEVETPNKEAAAKSLTAKVGRETAGRRGKGVTVVFDLALDETKLAELAAKLKQRCGTGGTVKDGRIEIQGDLRTRITAELEKLGYKVKRAGG
jgi:protein-tyrosine phosphatase